ADPYGGIFAGAYAERHFLPLAQDKPVPAGVVSVTHLSAVWVDVFHQPDVVHEIHLREISVFGDAEGPDACVAGRGVPCQQGRDFVRRCTVCYIGDVGQKPLTYASDSSSLPAEHIFGAY